MISFVEYLNIPTKIAILVVGVFFILQCLGELLEFRGKFVPEFLKIRKIFTRKKKKEKEIENTLHEVKKLLSDVNSHYSQDNISKRNDWIDWVNSSAKAYDNSITKINESLLSVTQALKDNTKMTEEMFIERGRDRIIDFATKVSDKSIPVSREEFNRIFKLYTKYENFLDERNLTNGEINVAYNIIKNVYEIRMKNHTFIEDIRGHNE